jgi:hypothetical protein
MFRHPMVDMRPSALLAIVIWFCHCLLRPESSPFITRQGVFHPLGRAWWRRSVSIAVFGGVWGFMVFGFYRGSFGAAACSTRAVFGGAFLWRQLLFWVFSCFCIHIVFDSLLCVRFSMIIASSHRLFVTDSIVQVEVHMLTQMYLSVDYIYL